MKRNLLSLIPVFILIVGCGAPITDDGNDPPIIPSLVAEPAPPQPSVTPLITPTPDLTCYETEMSGFRLSYDSAIMGAPVDYRVFLPPCYDAIDRQVPVLYLFHGMVPGTALMNDSQWDDLGVDELAEAGISRGDLPPFIIVLPDGNDMDYESDVGPLIKVLVDELIPLIDGSFCTVTEPWGRAVGGLSRGGFWALSLAMQHPMLFGRVGGHSPFLYDGAEYPANNPYNLADSVMLPESLVISIDHGAADFTANESSAFVSRLEARGIAPIYTVYPEGQHDESYWSAHISDYLRFYTEGWPPDTAAYISCGEDK